MEEKIRRMLSLPLAKRYEQGIAPSEISGLLEKNQDRLNESTTFKTIQVLKKHKVKYLLAGGMAV